MINVPVFDFSHSGRVSSFLQEEIKVTIVKRNNSFFIVLGSFN
jgi:hypothetical protein